jgi:hypothetical protein
MKGSVMPETRGGIMKSTALVRSLVIVLTIMGGHVATAAEEVVLTSLQGSAHIGTIPLESHGPLLGNEVVELGPDSRCSFLLGDRAVVHLSEEAELRFGRVGDGASRELDLRAGTMSLAVAGSASGKPIQVRTHSSVVSVAGGVVEVRIDPRGANTLVVGIEGASTVSGIAGGESVRLGAGEQVRVATGATSLQVLASSARVTHEPSSRAEALAIDRQDLAARDLQAIAMADIPEEGLPLAALNSAPTTLITELSKSATLDEPCDPITCNPIYQLPPPGECSGIPGGHCEP